jgi:hypothetical protein
VKKAAAILSLLFLLSGYSPAMMMPMMGGGMPEEMGAMPGQMHEFHPFLSHMGMPDSPGEISFRLTGFEQRLSGTSQNGYGAHLETGLWDRVGLHIRNDDIQRDGAEIMLQYAFLRSDDKEEGISALLEDELPGSTGETSPQLRIGLTAVKKLWGQPLHLAFHYGPSDKMSEYTASQIISVNERLGLIIEFSGESGGSASAYLLEGVKFRVTPSVNLGLAFQSPVTSNKEFDSKTLIQIESHI